MGLVMCGVGGLGEHGWGSGSGSIGVCMFGSGLLVYNISVLVSGEGDFGDGTGGVQNGGFGSGGGLFEEFGWV